MTAGMKALIYLVWRWGYGLVPGICCDAAAEYEDSFAWSVDDAWPADPSSGLKLIRLQTFPDDGRNTSTRNTVNPSATRRSR